MSQLPIWNETLSVGNAEIDAQHQQLLILNEQAVELLESGNHASASGRFHQVLDHIVELAERHFASEEAILTRKGCPTLAAHKAEHDAYIVMLAKLSYKAMHEKIDSKRMVKVLTKYVHDHLLGTDMQCKGYLADDGVRGYAPAPSVDGRGASD